MEKKIIDEYNFLFYASDFNGKTLKEVKEILEKHIADLGENTVLYYDYDTNYYGVEISRLETDVEYEARLKKEAGESERRIAEEKKLYEKLKAKYEL